MYSKNDQGDPLTHALLDHCVPPSLRHGSYSALRKARLLGGALLIGPVLILVMCVLLTLIDASNLHKLLPLYIGGLGFWGIMAVYWHRGSYDLSAHCTILLKNSLILYFSYLWGVGTPITVWLISSLVFSMYLMKKSWVTAHVLFLTAGTAVFAVLEASGQLVPIAIAQEHYALMALVAVVLALTFTFFVTSEVRYLYDRAELLLDREARTDALTQIPNRRHFFDHARAEAITALENDWAMAVILVDMDHFKRLNDNYGHATGDQALVTVAKILRKSVPQFVGFAARIAGDEFAALIPHSKITKSEHIAELIRQRVASAELTPRGRNNKVSLSVSVGVAEYYPTQGETIDDGLARADQLLYSAKENGRNQACHDNRLSAVAH